MERAAKGQKGGKNFSMGRDGKCINMYLRNFLKEELKRL
jgi:hypothetical protein